MKICNPTLGMRKDSGSGGEVYERELTADLARLADFHCHYVAKGFGRPPLVWALMTPVLRRCNGILRIHSLRYLGIPAILSRRPYVAHCHHLERGPWRPLEKFVLKRAWRVTVDSLATEIQVVGAGLWDTTKIHWVPGGVRWSARFPSFGKRVLFLGQKKWRKNPTFLAQLKMVDCFGPGWPSGPIPEYEKFNLYRGAALFVFPSLLEGFGLPILEAMAAGVPVIVSLTPALGELVQDGVQGRVLPLDLGLWAETIRGLLADPALRWKMGDAGIDRAKTFTWDRAARAWLKAVA